MHGTKQMSEHRHHHYNGRGPPCFLSESLDVRKKRVTSVLQRARFPVQRLDARQEPRNKCLRR